jgi:pimeloyl-ACP methyl ester carboxylesterase
LPVGFVGVDRYARNYWLYRGFPPPRDPAYVTQAGTQEHLHVVSAALGGRAQDVYVYLPPGYTDSLGRRYPVMYLLHGFPGRPLAFLLTVRMGVVEDELVAKNLAQPVILVMPFGSTGTFTDKEWADGIRRGEGWATFVARDLVRAIDARYRTIPTAAGRAIGGLSEGGYGALNIALHHPEEFGVVESWSGRPVSCTRRATSPRRPPSPAARDLRSSRPCSPVTGSPSWLFSSAFSGAARWRRPGWRRCGRTPCRSPPAQSFSQSRFLTVSGAPLESPHSSVSWPALQRSRDRPMWL